MNDDKNRMGQQQGNQQGQQDQGHQDRNKGGGGDDNMPKDQGKENMKDQ